MSDRASHAELRQMMDDAVGRIGNHAFWRHVPSDVVYVKVGLTLRESDLAVLIRYYQHGTVGVEFCRPLDEFLERFVPAPTPPFTGMVHR